MLGFMFEKTAGLLKDTYNAVETTAQFIIDDISSIPGSIAKGWDSGLMTTNTVEPTEADAVTPAKTPEPESSVNV